MSDHTVLLLCEDVALSKPALVAAAGADAAEQFVNFFTAEIRNPHTCAAYAEVVRRFLRFCEQHGDRLATIPMQRVAACVEQLAQTAAIPTVKQHLAAINRCFDYLVVHQVMLQNPVRAVRGPKYHARRGRRRTSNPRKRGGYSTQSTSSPWLGCATGRSWR